MSIVDTGRSDPFLATVKLLSDPAEMQKRFDALREAEEKAQATIALAGPAAEIVDMRRRIEADLHTAKTALGEARMQAGMLVDTARRKAQEIDDDIEKKLALAEAEVAALKDEEQQVLASTKAALGEAQSLKADLQGRLSEVDSLKSQLEHERGQLRGARAAFEDRLAALNNIAGQFQSALRSISGEMNGNG